jgi:general secretion pathway protein D
MVFLRPIVVRDAQQTESLSLDRYELMRAGQKEIQPKPSSSLSINEAPVMPPQLPAGTGAKTPPPLITPPSQPATPSNRP